LDKEWLMASVAEAAAKEDFKKVRRCVGEHSLGCMSIVPYKFNAKIDTKTNGGESAVGPRCGRAANHTHPNLNRKTDLSALADKVWQMKMGKLGHQTRKRTLVNAK